MWQLVAFTSKPNVFGRVADFITSALRTLRLIASAMAIYDFASRAVDPLWGSLDLWHACEEPETAGQLGKVAKSQPEVVYFSYFFFLLGNQPSETAEHPSLG